jgi:hypothetical protein
MKKLSKNIENMISKAQFKIKFETGPLESIALFEMGEKEYRCFSSKLGLVTTMLNARDWK